MHRLIGLAIDLAAIGVLLTLFVYDWLRTWRSPTPPQEEP